MTDENSDHTLEHHLPCTDAVLAATLALMTGYSQALQADTHPRQRLVMGEKIVLNLSMLSDRPGLSPGFCEVLHTLQRCWLAMSACTRDAAACCKGEVDEREPARPSPWGLSDGNSAGGDRLH